MKETVELLNTLMSNGKVIELAYSMKENAHYLVKPELNSCLTCGKLFSMSDLVEGLCVGNCEGLSDWLKERDHQAYSNLHVLLCEQCMAEFNEDYSDETL